MASFLHRFQLPVKRLSAFAQLPSRGSAGAVGYDLHANHPDEEEITLFAGMRRRFSTGIAVAVPVGYYGRVAPRSGLAFKHGLDVLAGVVDPDYRGEVFVILQNNGQQGVTIRHGDRIAQLILEQVGLPEVIEVETLDDTSRDAGGFGSTGR
jgi:dUTP pyrophosphatase